MSRECPLSEVRIHRRLTLTFTNYHGGGGGGPPNIIGGVIGGMLR